MTRVTDSHLLASLLSRFEVMTHIDCVGCFLGLMEGSATFSTTAILLTVQLHKGDGRCTRGWDCNQKMSSRMWLVSLCEDMLVLAEGGDVGLYLHVQVSSYVPQA